MGNNHYESFELGPTIRCGGRSRGCENECNGAAIAISGGNECVAGETHVYYEACDSAKEVTIASECHNEDSLGRVMDVSMTLCNVCPGRRCAVGVNLTEVDENGNEYQRGFRSLTVPAHNYGANRDIELPSLRFVMPEDVSVASNGCRRHFVVRTTNHYIEDVSDYRRR